PWLGLALAPAGGELPDGPGESGVPSAVPSAGGALWAVPGDEAGPWAGPAVAPAPAVQPAASRPASTSPATARLVRSPGARPGRGKHGKAGSVRWGEGTIRG